MQWMKKYVVRAPQTESKQYNDGKLCIFCVVDFWLLVDSMHLNNVFIMYKVSTHSYI